MILAGVSRYPDLNYYIITFKILNLNLNVNQNLNYLPQLGTNHIYQVLSYANLGGYMLTKALLCILCVVS